jgi:large subunit ribosomal protein L9
MEIILLQKISKLGNMGDTVRVKQGFGRNFLIPTGKALRATKENKAFFEETKVKLLEENKEAIEKAEKLRTEVESLKLAVVRSASDTGILYGSVTTRDISNLISAEGVTVSRKYIALDQPIKELGIYDVSIVFHPEVESKIKLRVVRSLSDNTFEAEDNSNTSKNSDEINEGLLEDGVSLKTEDVNSEEGAPQNLPEDELVEPRDGE